MKAFKDGFFYQIQGCKWLTKKPLRPFILIPLIINIVIFSAAIWFGFSTFESLMDRFLPQPDGDGIWATIVSWVRWVLWPLFASFILVITYYTFTIVANIIASPFNGLLAEKTEMLALGRPIVEEMSYKEMAIDIARSMLTELRKLLYFIMWFIPVIILGFIPLVQIIAPVVAALYSAWVFAVTYNDYPMANHRIFFKQQLTVLRANRWMAVGFGCAVLLMTLIPVVNFIAMPAAVIGATLMWHERFKDNLPAGVEAVNLDTAKPDNA